MYKCNQKARCCYAFAKAKYKISNNFENIWYFVLHNTIF
ncbi:hypothetical protein JCM19297_157 [Nonlabens ulvanivorans]|nr:hypothetical protein JCM19297_157 [Nonlabens ulvanivorans]